MKQRLMIKPGELIKDFSVTMDLYDYTNKFTTEAEVDADRKKESHQSLTAKETTLLRGVLGTASWRAQQVSPQCAVDVGLALSAVNSGKVSDLLEANKPMRDMRKSASQVIKFHPLDGYSWKQLIAVQWDKSLKAPPLSSKLRQKIGSKLSCGLVQWPVSQ